MTIFPLESISSSSTNSLADEDLRSYASSSASSAVVGATTAVVSRRAATFDEDVMQQRAAALRDAVRDHLTPYYDTQFNLLRWVQGHRDLPDEEIAKKLRAHLKMRKSSWNLDNLAQKPRDHPIHKHWVYGITGESKRLENVIVNIEQAGHLDYWSMRETFSVQQVLKARTQDMEDMLAQVMQLEARTGKQAWILFVLDLTGLRYDKRLINLIRGEMRALTEYMATHYVELINSFVLINAPSSMCAVWSIAKTVLPERTRQKVRILSSTNWRHEILDYATPEVLPAKWNLGDSEIFKAALDHPPAYPSSNYQKLKNKEQCTYGMEKWKIAAGKTLLVTREARRGETLEWFLVADADFGMGVYFSKNRDDENVEEMDVAYPILSWMPSGPSACPVSDFVTATQDGFFKLWLSNSHAWWTMCTIRGRLNVLPVDLL